MMGDNFVITRASGFEVGDDVCAVLGGRKPNESHGVARREISWGFEPFFEVGVGPFESALARQGRAGG